MLIVKQTAKDILAHFDSLEEYGCWVFDHKNNTQLDVQYNTEWGGNMSGADCLAACLHGVESLVPDFDADFDLTFAATSGWESRYAVDGHGHVNIGRYLAGVPNCIKTRRRNLSDIAPIKIGIITSAYSGVTAAQFKQRGTMLLNLVRAVSMSRSVELYAITADYLIGDGYSMVTCVRMQDKPLHLAQCAFPLAHVAYNRRVRFAMFTKLASPEHHVDISMGIPISDTNKVASMAGFGPKDVLFGAMSFTDQLARSNPQAWIQQEYARIMGTAQQ